jgi:hypothetical protein
MSAGTCDFTLSAEERGKVAPTSTDRVTVVADVSRFIFRSCVWCGRRRVRRVSLDVTSPFLPISSTIAAGAALDLSPSSSEIDGRLLIELLIATNCSSRSSWRPPRVGDVAQERLARHTLLGWLSCLWTMRRVMRIQGEAFDSRWIRSASITDAGREIQKQGRTVVLILLLGGYDYGKSGIQEKSMRDQGSSCGREVHGWYLVGGRRGTPGRLY